MAFYEDRVEHYGGALVLFKRNLTVAVPNAKKHRKPTWYMRLKIGGRKGYTLALDVPINTKTLALLESLDRITLNYGGRFYLAKDSRMSAETFAASDSRIEAFRAERKFKKWQTRFASAQSDRLGL